MESLHAQFVYTVRHAQQRLVDFTRLPASYGKQVVAEAEFFGIEVGDSPSVHAVRKRWIGDEFRHVGSFTDERVLG